MCPGRLAPRRVVVYGWTGIKTATTRFRNHGSPHARTPSSPARRSPPVSGTREGAIERAREHLESGAFLDDLRRRVAVPTESQERARAPELRRYLDDEMAPWLKRYGYAERGAGQSRSGRRPHPGRPAPRGRRPAHAFDLWSWRRRARHSRAVALRARSLDDHGRGRALVWPRHRRQQGPAQHRHGGARRWCWRSAAGTVSTRSC